LLFAIHDPEGQLIEYTQYLPGSMQFEDRGKHLGEGRVSRQVLGVTIPVKDVEAQAALYAKLGFMQGKRTGRTEFRLPGNSGQEIDLETGGAGAEILFEVSDTAKGAETLRSRGLKVERQGATVSVKDPDGNLVAFISEADRREAQ